MKINARKQLYVGQLVTVTEHLETQVYTVAEIIPSQNLVVLNWFEGSRFCFTDYDIDNNFFKPSLYQIEYSIAANGPLVSSKQLTSKVTAE